MRFKGASAGSEEDFRPLLKVDWAWRVACVFPSLVRSNSRGLFSVEMFRQSLPRQIKTFWRDSDI
jgi:hypothetical protein